MPEVIRGSKAAPTHDDSANPTPSEWTDRTDGSRPSLHVSRKSKDELEKEGMTRGESFDSAKLVPTQSPKGTSYPRRSMKHTSPSPMRHVAFDRTTSNNSARPGSDRSNLSPEPRPSFFERRRSTSHSHSRPRPSIAPEERPEADFYADSRAATKREWRRRATTLQEYYKENPQLLPQLPFTWHHGLRRFRLYALIGLMFIDACVLPIVLYYAMTFGGNVQGYITFAVITTIWGGPTYLEFGVRSWKLAKKERFYRPLGTTGRWCFDFTNYVSMASIGAVTGLFIIGSAPHIVWLRVLCMPAPALLYVLGASMGIVTLYHAKGWPAPCRLSSTAKGEVVRPGAYYFMEDICAVNANAGRPYREALAARYEASENFRRMLYRQSLMWSIPAICIAIPLTVIAVIHPVPKSIAYGICWGVPFVWAILWAPISIRMITQDMQYEREEWERHQGPTNIKELLLEDQQAGRPSIQPPAALTQEDTEALKELPLDEGATKEVEADESRPSTWDDVKVKEAV